MILAGIILIGAVLRFVNLLPYKFYPDAYQNLLVAGNISKFGSVVSTLGDNGYLFPPFFMWSRPVYPVLINLTNSFVNNPDISAQIVSFLAGIAAIPLSFLLALNIFSSRKIAVFTSLLTAVSFNHVVWSGFIMTETTGIMFLIIFGVLLFKNINSSGFLDFTDLLAGLVLSLAVFTRYEYVILAVSILYIVYNRTPNPSGKIITIFGSFFVTSAVIFSLFFPVIESIKIFWDQTTKFINIGISIAALAALSVYIFKKFRLNIHRNIFSGALKIIFILGFLWAITLPGFSGFVKQDFLLAVSSILGFFVMLKSEKYRHLGIFSMMSVFLLQIIYTNLNPAMTRYSIHTMPFLVILGGYFMGKLPGKIFINILLFSGILIQIFLSAGGIKKWHMGDWTRPSYEETSAKKLRQFIKNGDILVVAFPEPYYHFTGATVTGVGFESPYLNLDGFEGNPEMIIVNDTAMKDIFPDFYRLTESNLDKYKIGYYFTGTNYRYKTYHIGEEVPVNVYRIRLSDLKSRISDQNRP